MYQISIHPLWLVLMGFGLGFFMGTTTGLILDVQKRKYDRKDKK